MRQKSETLRIAAVALFASVVLPATPSPAQDVPVVTPPPPATTPPPVVTPPPVATTPPSAAQPQQRPLVNLAPRPPVSEPPAAEEERPAQQAERSTRRAPARERAEAPARREAPTPTPTSVAEPAAEAPAAPAPAAAAPLPSPAAEVTPLPVEPAPSAEAGTADTGSSVGMFWGLIGAAAILIVAALAFFAFRRRRAAEEYSEETVYEEPAHAAPVEPAYAAAPVAAAAIDETEIGAPADSDVEALAAASYPAANRPWLEFMMRPVRAGTEGDAARVEFELTVGNTGSVPAHDVRIATWLVAAGDATEMERMLIEPPADAQRSEVDIAPGDGARVDAAMTLPVAGLRGRVLPVVVADARYRLPDGREGRTSASFAVGLPNGDGLEPFAVEVPSGLHEDVEARLHGAPQRA